LFGVVLVLLSALGLGLWSQRDRIFATGAAGEIGSIPTVQAEVKTFQHSLRTTGTVAARRFATIRSPRMRGGSEGRRQQTLMKLAEAGVTVPAGTVVAEFENRWLEDHIDDQKSSLTLSESTVNKRRAEIMIEVETEQQSVRVAQANLDKAELDVRTVEVRSEIEAEKLKLAVEEMRAVLAQVTKEVALKQAVHEAEMNGLEITVDKRKLHVTRHLRDLEHLKAQTPVGGLIVMESLYRGSGQFEQVQVGDQVNAGTFFMRVVDLSKMVVNGIVNQVDSQRVRIGQKAEVRLDAYPSLVLPGTVTSISAMAGGSGGGMRWQSGRDNYVRTVAVQISIDGMDKRLIPDLSASADIVLTEEEGALVIPNAAIQHSGDKPMVMVRQGEKFVGREIEVGLRSGTEAVVLAGLEAGDEVAMKPVPQA
jgi:multidrug resistance efflux pump